MTNIPVPENHESFEPFPVHYFVIPYQNFRSFKKVLKYMNIMYVASFKLYGVSFAVLGAEEFLEQLSTIVERYHFIKTELQFKDNEKDYVCKEIDNWAISYKIVVKKRKAIFYVAGNQEEIKLFEDYVRKGIEIDNI